MTRMDATAFSLKLSLIKDKAKTKNDGKSTAKHPYVNKPKRVTECTRRLMEENPLYKHDKTVSIKVVNSAVLFYHNHLAYLLTMYNYRRYVQ